MNDRINTSTDQHRPRLLPFRMTATESQRRSGTIEMHSEVPDTLAGLTAGTVRVGPAARVSPAAGTDSAIVIAMNPAAAMHNTVVEVTPGSDFEVPLVTGGMELLALMERFGEMPARVAIN